MAGTAKRTLVCSVLFVDIVGYSKKGVDEQVRLKQRFNAVLSSALQPVAPQQRIVVDTGDGAAVSFLENPEAALFSALAMLDHVGDVPVRMGINLGPVTLMEDINGRDNMIGDGINAAERVMGFAKPGQLLVSRTFHEVVSHLSHEYAAMFRKEAARTDKHERAHELYAVADAVRVGRRVAHAQERLREERRAAPAASNPTPPQVFDTGTHFVVSGYSEQAVRATVKQLEAQGHKLLSPVVQVGSKWLASVDNPKLSVAATVKELGFKHIISGATREAVMAEVRELLERGARLVQDPELADGVWTAVCERT